jgi:hypothetical protein
VGAKSALKKELKKIQRCRFSLKSSTKKKGALSAGERVFVKLAWDNWGLLVERGQQGEHLVIQSTRRAQQEARRGCEECLSSYSRAIWRIQWIIRRTSLGLLLHYLVVHLPKWICPLACHPATGTVHAASRLRPMQTPTTNHYLQQSEKFKFQSQITFSLFFLLNPRLFSFFDTASTWTKVLRLANCIPLSVHQSRALYQVIF